jgi:hypothetical protein
MIKLLHSLLCTDLLVDQVTKRFSYINIITDGRTQSLPTNMPSMYVATSWFAEKEPGPFKIRIIFISPSGEKKELLKNEIEAQDGKHRRYQFNLRVNSLPVNEEGMHYFFIEHKTKAATNWKTDNKIPLYIEKIKPEEPKQE